jgi:hypothetical protein
MASSAKPGWVSRPPRVGNIITCLYPNDPKGRLRPCLVLEVLAGSKGGFAVRVAYGTKSLDKATRGKIDVIIESRSDIDECGIAVPTRFDLEETATILWEPPDCGCWQGESSPVLGELPTIQQVDCAYKLQAIQNKQRRR